MLRFLIFVVGVMAAGTSIAEGVSPCPVDSLPIQIVGEVGSSPEITLSAGKGINFATHVGGSNPRFETFSFAVMKHVLARLGKENLCLDNAESKKPSLLQFVHWYLQPSGIGRITPITRLDADTWPSPPSGCRLYSPWIDLAIERKPVPWIRAIVRWNERQFIADQAALNGVKNVPLGIAMPLTNHEYGRFGVEYVNSEILGKPTARQIEERVPPDLLWLFRHSPQKASSPGNNIGKVRKKGAEYTKLILALIDRCFTSGEADFHYNSIFDVTDLILLEQYKVETQVD